MMEVDRYSLCANTFRVAQYQYFLFSGFQHVHHELSTCGSDCRSNCDANNLSIRNNGYVFCSRIWPCTSIWMTMHQLVCCTLAI